MATQDEYLRAIQRKCLDCCGGQKEEVANCEIGSCPLHPYRLGQRQGSLFIQKELPGINTESSKQHGLFGNS